MEVPQVATPSVGATPQAAPVIEVVVPPAANTQNLVWNMSMSDSSNQPVVDSQSVVDDQSVVDSQPILKNEFGVEVGYITVGLTATLPSGEKVTSLDAPIEIRLPKARPEDGVLAWSRDDITWRPIRQLQVRELPAGVPDGYFVEADGTVTVISRHLTGFGIRKPQAPLKLSVARFDIISGSVSRAVTEGGTSEDPILYQTMSDPSVCAVTETGLIYGLSAGTCTVVAKRGGGSIYMDTSSPIINAKVVGAIVPVVPKVGRLALAIQLAVLVALCVLLLTLGRRMWLTIQGHRSHRA